MVTKFEIQESAEKKAFDARISGVLQACKIVPHRWMDGESVDDFRVKTLASLQKFSTVPKNDLRAIAAFTPENLDFYERTIATDALRHAQAQPDQREVHLKDRSGREIIEFVGGGFSWAQDFKAIPQRGDIVINGEVQPVFMAG